MVVIKIEESVELFDDVEGKIEYLEEGVVGECVEFVGLGVVGGLMVEVFVVRNNVKIWVLWK
ncbi:hypothetical protein [Bacillus thuringiensis]|uniref:hypothetical protein n=1 Tax=Bacillus thuringiensis TaxID=1428 RepID=UPI0011AA6E95|nr:hypothetical protein [Bacillus thuringiensis]